MTRFIAALVTGIVALLCIPHALANDFPVTCGAFDDSPAIQAQIDNASVAGGRVVLPVGLCNIRTPITVSASVTVEGAGFPGWMPYPSSGRGTVLIAHSDVFRIKSNEAVHLRRFQIEYRTPLAGSVAISIDGATPAQSNLGSTVTEVVVGAADTCLKVISATSLDIGNNNLIGCRAYSVSMSSVTYPDSGDNDLHDNTISGEPVGAHIAIFSGGGLRITNNKLNLPGVGMGILIAPSLVTHHGVSPLMIVGNSIEGASYGIMFQRPGGATMTTRNIVITANEIVAQVIGIASQGSGGQKWVIGLTISGNFIQLGAGGSGVALDGTSIVLIDGNTFIGGGSAAVWSGTTMYSDYVTIGANAKGPGVT